MPTSRGHLRVCRWRQDSGSCKSTTRRSACLTAHMWGLDATLTMPPRLKRSVLDCLKPSTAVGPPLEDAMATHDTVALMTGACRGLRLDTACGRGKLGGTVRLGARDRATGA